MTECIACDEDFPAATICYDGRCPECYDQEIGSGEE